MNFVKKGSPTLIIFNICGIKKRPEVAKKNIAPIMIIKRISFL